MTPPNVEAKFMRATRVSFDACNMWQIQCPYCGQRHVHGAGRPSEDPKNFLGHRSAHCIGHRKANSEGYMLTWNGEET